ncbi:MAG: peptide chain release factor N(5)-glutamine methyltransferase [Rhodospirillaceae bacterium]|nr:peptide chain release factor N(5)-glutamine methyltransferase [Rhodospirillaceae bacterium]
MPTLRDAILETTATLKQAGVDNPRLDARLLVAHVLQADAAATFLRNDTALTDAQTAQLAQIVQRRVSREPVSRIIGTREFWGLPFEVISDTLDPRPDTETLVSAVIDHARRLKINAPRILDLGTGTGCIALALLQAIPEATAVAVDVNEEALRTAARNADRNHLAQRIHFARMSWMEGLSGPFDVIVSNPPYLSADDMARLEPEVRYDPALALYGGDDGLDCYRAIIGDARLALKTPALLAFEVGAGQAGPVVRLLEESAFRVVEIRSDLASIPRCVVAEI